MGKLSLFLLITLISANILACPDFTGTYKRVDASFGCKMDHKKSLRHAYPLALSMGSSQDGFISDGETFKLTQKGCEKINVHYYDPTYIQNQRDRTQIIDLTKGKVEVTKNSLSYVQKEKVSTDCYIGCSTGKTNRKFTLTVNDNKTLTIKSKKFTIALLNFVVPWIETDRVKCTVEKID
jgi:hypothetical protein